MRAGSDGRPRRPYNGNRPPQREQQRGPRRDQTFDSNGPGVKIRGTAHQVFERYVALAREAAIGGDPVAAENLYQHAEHYFRLGNAGRDAVSQGAPRPMPPTDPAQLDQEPGGTEDPRLGFGDDRSGFI